jgi:hypothetical protein
MRVAKKRRRWMTALVAAFVLLLNVFVVGLGDGARAAAEITGDFSAFICTEHGNETTPAAPDGSGKGHLPECCTFGCSAVAHQVAPSPPLLPVRAYDRVVHTPARYDAPLQRAKRLQLNPRAPPAAI